MSDMQRDPSGASRSSAWTAVLRRLGMAVAPSDAPGEDEQGAAAIRRRVGEFEDACVRDVMTSRVDIAALDVGASLEEALARFSADGHSRMPLCRGSLEECVGFVHIKDIIARGAEGGWSRAALEQRSLESLARRILFVPEAMRLSALLVEMRSSRLHMAIVIDEYGGVSGLVCLEDLIEAIVGDIEDEHDPAAPEIIPRSARVWEADGLATLSDIRARTGLDLALTAFEADVETIGGLVAALAGRLPAVGETIEHPGGVMIDVIEAEPPRIGRVRLRLPGVRETGAAGA
jgi:CBS domain containing-hemolysin-like protein